MNTKPRRTRFGTNAASVPHEHAGALDPAARPDARCAPLGRLSRAAGCSACTGRSAYARPAWQRTTAPERESARRDGDGRRLPRAIACCGSGAALPIVCAVVGRDGRGGLGHASSRRDRGLRARQHESAAVCAAARALAAGLLSAFVAPGRVRRDAYALGGSRVQHHEPQPTRRGPARRLDAVAPRTPGLARQCAAPIDRRRAVSRAARRTTAADVGVVERARWPGRSGLLGAARAGMGPAPCATSDRRT